MRTSSRYFLLSVILGLSVGCGGDESAAGSGEGAGSAGGSSGAGASGGGGPIVVEEGPDIAVEEGDEARPTWTEDTYELTAVATGPYAVGTPSTFELRLTPRGEYHVNLNYPWSVTISPPAAVLVPTATFDSATAAEMTETVARFVVPFTPTAAGSHDVTAVVDFGICRAEACIFQMRNVLVHIAAGDAAPGATVPAEGAAAVPAEGAAAPPAEGAAVPAGAAAAPPAEGAAPSAPPSGLEGMGATSAAPPARPVPELPGGRS